MGGEGEKQERRGCSAPLKAAAEGISTVKAPANCSFPLKRLMLYFDKHTCLNTHTNYTQVNDWEIKERSITLQQITQTPGCPEWHISMLVSHWVRIQWGNWGTTLCQEFLEWAEAETFWFLDKKNRSRQDSLYWTRPFWLLCFFISASVELHDILSSGFPRHSPSFLV